MPLQRLVSGAQTGVDRAALDVALELGLDCGGWVPKGRLDENGRIPEYYPNLVEAASADPKLRTRLNVRDSDATLILTHGALFGGPEYTKRMADEIGRPCKHVDLARFTVSAAVSEIREWLSHVQPAVLNIAGPRASDDREIYAKAKCVLAQLLRNGSRLGRGASADSKQC